MTSLHIGDLLHGVCATFHVCLFVETGSRYGDQAGLDS